MRFVEQDLADVMVMARETTVPGASADPHDEHDAPRSSEAVGPGRCSLDPKRDTDRYRLVMPVLPSADDV